MELKDIVSRYRAENHLSQREFAARCKNISHAYIAIIENDFNPNTRKPAKPSVDKLKNIAAGMGISFERLLAMMEDKAEPAPEVNVVSSHEPPAVPGFQTSAYTPARAMVPVIGSVRCGSGGLAFEELQGAEMADVANPSEYFYLTTTGDSMAPDIKEGDLVLVHIQPTVETGELAVVIINGEEGTLKKLLKRENAVILQSLNPAFPPRVLVGEELENMRIVGKAVQLVRKW